MRSKRTKVGLKRELNQVFEFGVTIFFRSLKSDPLRSFLFDLSLHCRVLLLVFNLFSIMLSSETLSIHIQNKSFVSNPVQ